MIGFRTFGPMLLTFASAVMPVAPGLANERPKKSSDVVEVTLKTGTLAEGFDYYVASIKVAKGWHVYANPVQSKTLLESATTIEFLLDGKSADASFVYPKGRVRKDADGKEYRAYEDTVSVTGAMLYEDTRKAHIISVRVNVIATDGKTRLTKSVVTAELR